MSDIKLSDFLKALPSVFFMSPDAIVSMGGHSDLCITARNGELLTRRLVAEGYSRDRLIGGFVVSWFIQNAIKIYPKAFPQARIPNEIESPAELLEISDSDITLCRSGLYEVELFALEDFNLNIENSGSEDDYYLALPKIECDRLTISSKDSVWNHFKMCANIASSMEDGVVNLITSDRNSIEIHASSDHEEYRAEIPLIGGEPPDDQCVGIPVALINEVSYWMEAGLHTEAHLDIWFDENHVKIGTKTNQAFTKIEEYQSQKFDWTQKSDVQVKSLSTRNLADLEWCLTEFVNINQDEIPINYAPLLDLCVEHGEFSVEANLYQLHENSVSVGMRELMDFSSFIDLTQDYDDLILKTEVNPAENHVIFSGETFCHDAGLVVPFNYLVLGVIPNIQDEVHIPGHCTNHSSPFYEEEVCLWTGPCTESYEGVTFIERYPLDFKADSNPKKNSKQWQSVSKQEPPLNNLIKLINNLKNEINDFLESYSISVTEIIEEEIGNIELLNIKALDILEIFKSKYPSDYQNYSLLTQAWYDLNHAVNQTISIMFDPETTNTSMQTLEKVHKEAQWVYFRFLNKYYWGNENLRLWQQTFNDVLTVDDLETAIAAKESFLEELSIRNLKKLASKRKIKNYGNLTKDQLILAISV